MRWLLLNHNLRGRGSWHRAWGIARELARRGEAVELWTAAPHHYYRPAREMCDGVRIVETPSWSPWVNPDDGWGPLDFFYRMLRSGVAGCDVVYAFAHPPNNYGPAWVLHKLRGKKLLYDWCDWYADGIFPKREELRRAGLGDPQQRALQRWAEQREVGLERRMPRLADRVTVISEKLRELALGLGCRPERVLLLPNGAELEGTLAPEKAASRAALGLPPGGEYLAYIANYHPDEEFFLRAMARAVALRPGIKLIKTGPPFGERLVRELGLGTSLIDLGRVPEERLKLIFGAADALALPVEENPHNVARLPFKFTEYLATGRPQVACRVGDVGAWFARAEATVGAIGLTAEPTSESFGAALAGIFDAQCDREALGRNARRFAEVEFAWPQLVAKLLAFSQSVG